MTPLLDPTVPLLKLSHTPNMLHAIAEQMIKIFGVYKCTINEKKYQIIGDELYEERKRTMAR